KEPEGSSLMNLFEQEMSELRSSMNSVQTKEHAIAKKMQHVNKNFQTISDTWKESLDKINSEIANLKSESKNMHSKISSEINAVEEGVKDLTKKLEDLKLSTKQNTRAIQQQEKADLKRLEKQLELNARTILNLEDHQNDLIAKDTVLMEKLTEYDTKLKECQEQLPIIDNGIHSILKVSSEFLSTEKKIEDLTFLMFNLEDSMLKVINNIQEIKTQLEASESDDMVKCEKTELRNNPEQSCFSCTAFSGKWRVMVTLPVTVTLHLYLLCLHKLAPAYCRPVTQSEVSNN
uniref:IKBKB interacting protein n=1 Tax=Callorhinchus milii TaxID=7868 RepID=A0A4W3IN85_CALMI